MLETGEALFARHLPQAVFFGRFILGLRTWASWLAGATRMDWRSFVVWNALGGICWATAIGLLAYVLGHAAGGVVETFGIFGLVAGVLATGGGFIPHRRDRRRRAQQRRDGTAARAPAARQADD